MSTIDNVIGKIEELLTGEKYIITGEAFKDLEEILSLLKDKTVLFLEWNEEDIQQVAREKLSFLESCPIEEIIEKPLRKEDVIYVIGMLGKRYDCNNGITWETINCALDDIALPDSELCRVKLSYPLCNNEGRAKVKTGLYLGLTHGFFTHEQRNKAQEWGAAGPLIGPLKFAHVTYMSTIHIEFENPEDAKRYEFDASEVELDIDNEQCIVFRDMQYGDWTVEYIDNKEVTE